MPTKTALPTFADALAAAVDEHRASYQAMLEEVADGDRAISGLETALEEAQEQREDVESDVLDGTAQEPGLALAKARGDVEAAELHLGARKRRIAALKKRLFSTTTQTDAAWGVVPALRRAYPGIPVLVTSGPVPACIVADEVPVLVVRQANGADTTDGRTVRSRKAGEAPRMPVTLEVVLLRSPLHREMSARTFETAFNDTDTYARAVAVTTDNLAAPGVLRDYARVETHESAPVPVVLAYDASPEGAATHVSDALGRKVAKNLRLAIDGRSVARVATTVEDGIRTTTVTGSTGLRQPGYRPDERGVREEGIFGISYTPRPIERPTDLVGKVFTNLGRLTEVDVERVADDRSEWTVTLVSRVDHDTPHPAI